MLSLANLPASGGRGWTAWPVGPAGVGLGLCLRGAPTFLPVWLASAPPQVASSPLKFGDKGAGAVNTFVPVWFREGRGRLRGAVTHFLFFTPVVGNTSGIHGSSICIALLVRKEWYPGLRTPSDLGSAVSPGRTWWIWDSHVLLASFRPRDVTTPGIFRLFTLVNMQV